jgi:hypothetical protein
MKAYLVTVETTSPLKGTFMRGEQYFPCIDGQVYVFAKSIAEAAALLPMALEIKEVGISYGAPLPLFNLSRLCKCK